MNYRLATTVLVLFTAASCASLTPAERKGVRVTRNAEQTKGCEFLGLGGRCGGGTKQPERTPTAGVWLKAIRSGI
jgi:hypothetical protein